MQKRLTKEEALDLIKNADLKTLGKMASERKRELHPKGITTFVIDRNINYTNICWVDCKFCAFYRHEKDADAYVLTFDEIDAKIDELLEIGG
ncbi:MAG: dehypoxanthine futalosine cyclase, partial [Sulfurimonas sp.]